MVEGYKLRGSGRCGCCHHTRIRLGRVGHSGGGGLRNRREGELLLHLRWLLLLLLLHLLRLRLDKLLLLELRLHERLHLLLGWSRRGASSRGGVVEKGREGC